MARITVEGDTVTIDGVALKSAEIAGAFGEVPEAEREDFLKNAVLMGILARNATTDRFKVAELATEIRRIVSGTETSVDKIKSELEAKVEELLKAALASIHSMAMSAEQKEAQRKEVEGIKSRTSQAGRDYEQAVCDELSEIASVYGAHSENVGDVDGKSGKKGDCLIQFDEGLVVFEVKKGTEPDADGKRKRFTIREVKAELIEAVKNRGADYGVFVTRDVASLPKEIHTIGAVGGGQYMACGLEDDGNPLPRILQIVCQVARIRMAAQSSQSPAINAARIETSCTQAQDALNDTIKICKNIQAATTRMEGETLKRVEGSLCEILAALAPAGGPGRAA